MMNHATKQAAMVPATTSTFCENKSFTVRPFSTTLLWLKNIIHGAMVVPIMAMTSETKLWSLTMRGTTVLASASSQFGCAMNAATTYVTNTQRQHQEHLLARACSCRPR